MKSTFKMAKEFGAPYIYKIHVDKVKWYHILGAAAIMKRNSLRMNFSKTKAYKKYKLIKWNLNCKIESFYNSRFYKKWYKFKTQAKLLFGLLTWVNVYSITREYGGPEEGGWWYNAYQCQESYLVFSWNADKTIEKVKKEWEYLKFGDIYSVLGGTDLWVGEEKHRAESETRERPYYC